VHCENEARLSEFPGWKRGNDHPFHLAPHMDNAKFNEGNFHDGVPEQSSTSSTIYDLH
jgi:hypothetical protein